LSGNTAISTVPNHVVRRIENFGAGAGIIRDQYITKLHLQGAHIGGDAPDHTIHSFDRMIQETQHAL
jgi:hypothetical protein